MLTVFIAFQILDAGIALFCLLLAIGYRSRLKSAAREISIWSQDVCAKARKSNQDVDDFYQETMSDISRSYEGALVSHFSQVLETQRVPEERIDALAHQAFDGVKAEVDARFHVLSSARNILREITPSAEKVNPNAQ
jgi:hypothetical protein